MKLLPFILLFFTSASFAQTTGPEAPRDDNYKDTTYRKIILPNNLSGKKIIVWSFFKYADIYIKYADFENLCTEMSKNEFSEKPFTKLLAHFRRLGKETDTIKYTDYSSDFGYIASQLLKSCNAKVFDKRLKQFTDTIYQRPERFGSMMERFYYLPDKTAFFSHLEYVGILDEDTYKQFNQHYADYGKLYDRIQQTTGRTHK